MSQAIWPLITFPLLLQTVFSTLTGLKFDILFLFALPLSDDITDAVLAFSGKTLCVRLVFMAFASNGVKKSAESFTTLGGIVSMPLTFLYLDFSGL